MGVVITRDDIIAYAEVDYIIHHMNEKYLNMLPKKLVSFLDEMKDPTCEVYVNPRLPLQSQGLKRYTLELLALLHLKYWCEDEERKKELYARMEYNQIKFEEEMKQKFDVDGIFSDEARGDDTEREDLSKPKKVTVIDNLKNNKKTEDNEETKNVENIDNNVENSEQTLNKEEISDTSKKEEKSLSKNNEGSWIKRIILKIKRMLGKKEKIS